MIFDVSIEPGQKRGVHIFARTSKRAAFRRQFHISSIRKTVREMRCVAGTWRWCKVSDEFLAGELRALAHVWQQERRALENAQVD